MSGEPNELTPRSVTVCGTDRGVPTMTQKQHQKYIKILMNNVNIILNHSFIISE